MQLAVGKAAREAPKVEDEIRRSLSTPEQCLVEVRRRTCSGSSASSQLPVRLLHEDVGN